MGHLWAWVTILLAASAVPFLLFLLAATSSAVGYVFISAVRKVLAYKRLAGWKLRKSLHHHPRPPKTVT